jgi:hypothetical protein
MVIFDKARALDQIRSVLAEMKKKKQQCRESTSNSKDMGEFQNVRRLIFYLVLAIINIIVGC